MNRLIPFLIVAVLAFGVAGCNKTSQNPASSVANNAAQVGEAAEAAAAEAAAKAGAVAAAAGEAAAEASAVAGAQAAAAAETAAAAAAAAAKAAAPAAPAGIEPADWSAVLMDPKLGTATAPETFGVLFTTTKGPFTLNVTRAWAPKGADRLFNLVNAGFFTDIAFFRCVEGFMVQFGIHGDPKVATAWRPAEFGDDPVTQSNKRGYLSFATRGKDTRTTQMFISFKDNPFLDGMGFAPVGFVDDDGMKVVDSLYKGYGEGAPGGQGPDQMRMQMEGNTYLKADFAKLDYVQKAEIVAK